MLLAHRGDHGRSPENSLAAFAAALGRQGCAGLELDVRHAADGTPIVLHDPDLRRVQGRLLAASALLPESLATFGVPTLVAALAATPRRAFLDVELKELPTTATLAPLRARRGGPAGGLRRAVLSSFDPGHLAEARRLEPAWPRWLNVDTGLGPAEIALARELGCAALAADWRHIDARTARAVAAAGLGLAAWTITRRPTLDRLVRLGILAAIVEGAALPA